MDSDQARTFRLQLMALYRRLQSEHVQQLPLGDLRVLGAVDRLSGRDAAPDVPEAQRQLSTTGGPTPSEVADDLHQQRPNVAAAVTRLRADGLLDRVPDDADRRRGRLRLTHRGRQLLLRDRQEREGWLRAAATERLTAAELSTLITAGELMQRLADTETRQTPTSDRNPR